jgi:solute carrier family 25 iron transporter 28/37
MAGALATIGHDAVATPLDVVKQRLQMYGSRQRYATLGACVRSIAKTEGYRAFYASYPITVCMNVPFMAVHFAVYEGLKKSLTAKNGGEYTVPQQMLAGGIAGGMGGVVSTPFDVIKTRIQTQTHAMATEILSPTTTTTTAATPCEPLVEAAAAAATETTSKTSMRRVDVAIAFKEIMASEGVRGFWRGGGARVLYFMPSAAICWTAYETAKTLLGFTHSHSHLHGDDHHHHEHHHDHDHDHHDHDHHHDHGEKKSVN